MKKTIAIISVILLVALNVLAVSSVFYTPTAGLGMNGSLKWSDKTVEFVEENFGHYKNDFEKVEAFKTWVINNIEYTPYIAPIIQTMNVDKTIESKEGICFEQASVFTIFCRISGIECYNVDGRAKANFFTAHTWNRYCIDGVWYEIDITHDQAAMSKNTKLYGVNQISDLHAEDKTFNIYRIY